MSPALTDLRVATLMSDRTGRVTAANARCGRLFGTDPVGVRLQSLFPGEPDVAGRLARAGGESVRLLSRPARGSAFHVEVQATPGPDGSLTCRVWCIDV